MRISLAATVAALAATCTAEFIDVIETCKAGTNENCPSNGWFNGYYSGRPKVIQFNAADGCKSQSQIGSVGLSELCMDWARQRAHFRYHRENDKRCLHMEYRRSHKEAGPCNSGSKCFKSYWKEIKCYW